MHIIDVKYGQGALVDAEDNPHMKLYALSTLKMYDALYDIEKVSISIFQPRRKNRSSCKYSDEVQVAETAKEHGYSDIYKQSLITLTEMEKLMGKKVFQKIGDNIKIDDVKFKNDAVNYYYSRNESCEETAKKLKITPSSLNR